LSRAKALINTTTLPVAAIEAAEAVSEKPREPD
jgi:hypothetical protein